MDKYPKLRALLQEEWGGLYGFCKASDISRTTVRRLIQGRLGEAAEEKQGVGLKQASGAEAGSGFGLHLG